MSIDLLLEIGTEELPASFIAPALSALSKGIGDKFDGWGLIDGDASPDIDVQGTPRRLVLIVKGLPEMTPKRSLVVTGPPARAAFDKEGNATRAGIGFARGKGLGPDALRVVETAKGPYVAVDVEEGGESVKSLLEGALPALITGLPFRKTMRWGASTARFGRPLRWIVALLGEGVLDFEVNGLKAGRTSQGLRFFGAPSFDVTGAQDYKAQLEKGGIVLEATKRKAIIRGDLHKLAKEVGGVAAIDEALLDEVADLVEHPKVIRGGFSERYLEMPSDVPITVMKVHQRYFQIVDADGKLMNYFLQVINNPIADIPTVIKGNERVLVARLSDGAFFWKEDLKTPLESLLPQLDGIIFHAKLGTLRQKVDRIGLLSAFLAKEVGADATSTSRAALLCKADLVSQMVGEFPKLQGKMGMVYAEKGGESSDVAQAIHEHYLPKEAGGALPSSTLGCVISVADKMDSVVAFHGIGKAPTGAADPYALRRAALGLLRILMASGWTVSLSDLVDRALSDQCDALNGPAKASMTAKIESGQLKKDILLFFRTRLKGLLVSEGIATDLVEATLAAGCDQVAAAASRARALHDTAQSESFRALMTAFKRAVNISRGQEDGGDVATQRLDGVAAELRDAVAKVGEQVRLATSAGDYPAAFSGLLALKEPVDAFFDNVMVMDSDLALREARLAVLHRVVALFTGLADFSQLSA